MSLLRRTPLKAKTRIRPVSKKRAAKRQSAEGRAGMLHMKRVKALPCVICGKPGPSDAHHCIHDRYGTDKRSDFAVLPLCVECHRHPHPNAIHTAKQAWRDRNGPDYQFLPVVADMLAGELN
ncbi:MULTISPECIES: DUF968 domain-containing protein [unclassified Sulfitobacter]|jgi:hypothetical protein|uniref:DUF968 domain-containing protein n=1 Tax=unclassified Sulfitobacter TaxID=196795 RepID=UPI0007C222A5|nr:MULTISPECIES: DUF968 domain-containing protein [unclassified Sulfitobacter]KZY05235.1 hypothetical protein A3721_14990 [Sulfitobacter sp. HI0023]KZY25619.1 hypothetical protein A3728_18340 [Sulfitobacter sp. HI0040]KZZ66200.1 hypothetical protein A3764_17605 [Sulfitobacter sp. HI0129]